MTIIEEIKILLSQVLHLGNRTDSFDEQTPLIGALPELDSMAVVGMITAMEEHFDFIVADDEISVETFNTLGTLVQFVEHKLTA